MHQKKLTEARLNLDHAIQALNAAHGVWSEAVTALHTAELKLREAQRELRRSYHTIADALNGDA